MSVEGAGGSSITISISGITNIVNCSAVAGVDEAVRARHAPQRFLTRGGRWAVCQHSGGGMAHFHVACSAGVNMGLARDVEGAFCAQSRLH